VVSFGPCAAGVQIGEKAGPTPAPAGSGLQFSTLQVFVDQNFEPDFSLRRNGGTVFAFRP
tara:strand:- start:89 stop:268 length:180 start_codon:yes stop_codon:yes gene_type:complete